MPVYANIGNRFLVDRVPYDAKRILDVGCGCGDNARLIKDRNPSVWVEGITHNSTEAGIAASILDKVHTIDLEKEPIGLEGVFDCLIFSHVLEHLRHPDKALLQLLPRLRQGGAVVIAVPNVLEWRTRLKFLRGEFLYSDFGILDRTHVRFYTFNTADVELLGGAVAAYFDEIEKSGDGAVPLWFFRRFGFLRGAASAIDRMGVRYCPNLFAQQVIIVARRSDDR